MTQACILPSKEDFLNDNSVESLPLYCKVREDTFTPIGIFEKLKMLSPTFLLESAGEHGMDARYSYIGLDTEEVTSSYTDLTKLRPLSPVPLYYMRQLPPFYNGYIGYVSYEHVQDLYHIEGHHLDQHHQVLKCQSMVIIDHDYNDLYIIYNAAISPSAYEEGLKRIYEVLACLNGPAKTDKLMIPGFCQIKSNMTKADFFDKVQKIKSYIQSGEVFQVVLSQCFSAHTPSIDSFLLYKSVRRLNPSAYLSYIKFRDKHIICSSPEMLIKCSNGKVETAPIAGTRPLKNDGKDHLRALELLKDPKERAEHTMLVDLGRNDLNKISKPGTQRVTSFCQLKKYSKVMHLVSAIEGQLQNNLTSLEAMLSVFPAGTVSGAPKKRALEIIYELEPTPRDLYAGSIFYINLDGTLNSCIGIRTIQIENDYLYLQTGAGIVYDSIPDDEYKETLNKAKALLTAIANIYEGGIKYDFSD